MKKLNKDIVRGDKIKLDMGYGPREYMQFVKVLEAHVKLSQLFPDEKRKDWTGHYCDDGTERFQSITFSPEHEFETQ